MLSQIYSSLPESLKSKWRLFKKSEFRWRYLDNFSATFCYRTSKKTLNPIHQEILKQLNNQGVAVSSFSSFFGSDELLDELTQEVENIELQKQTEIQEARQNAESVGDEKSFQIWLLGQKTSLDQKNIFLKIASHPQVVEFANAYFGMQTRLCFFNVWRNFAIKHKPIRSQLWHQDRDDFRILKMFIYLNDVDAESGPMFYVPRTHSGGGIKEKAVSFLEEGHKNKRVLDEEMKKVVSENEWMQITGKAGTVIFVDTTGYHKGGYVLENERLVYNSMYLSPSAYIDDFIVKTNEERV